MEADVENSNDFKEPYQIEDDTPKEDRNIKDHLDRKRTGIKAVY